MKRWAVALAGLAALAAWAQPVGVLADGPRDWIVVVEASQYPSGTMAVTCWGDMLDHGAAGSGVLTYIKCHGDADGIFADGFDR